MENERRFDHELRPWRDFLAHEAFEYLFNFAFLAVFLVAFAWYRRLILAAYGIHYLHYWMPLIEAAILAKVIMLGDALRVGRRFLDKPLAFTTVYRSVVFSLFVVLFSLLEHIVGAMIHGKSVADGWSEIANKGSDEALAWYVIILVAFLPFFAMKEIERAIGAEKVRKMFFQRRMNAPDCSVSDQRQRFQGEGQRVD